MSKYFVLSSFSVPFLLSTGRWHIRVVLSSEDPYNLIEVAQAFRFNPINHFLSQLSRRLRRNYCHLCLFIIQLFKWQLLWNHWVTFFIRLYTGLLWVGWACVWGGDGLHTLDYKVTSSHLTRGGIQLITEGLFISPFITPLQSSRYYLNNVDRDVNHQIIIIIFGTKKALMANLVLHLGSCQPCPYKWLKSWKTKSKSHYWSDFFLTKNDRATKAFCHILSTSVKSTKLRTNGLSNYISEFCSHMSLVY